MFSQVLTYLVFVFLLLAPSFERLKEGTSSKRSNNKTTFQGNVIDSVTFGKSNFTLHLDSLKDVAGITFDRE
jgi:hypothetical protein